MSTQFNCQKQFQAIQLGQSFLIQLIQFSISIDYTQLNFKTVLIQTIQLFYFLQFSLA